MTNAQPDAGPGLGAALGWGCYLGSSWTWVIGMILPALLLRDYGPWGWFAFAIPNVLGAMAMGLLLSPQRSAAMADRHVDMGLRFSEVTIAYHGFVAAWLFPKLLGLWALPTVLVLMASLWLAVRPRRAAMATAVLVSLVSLAMLAVGRGQEEAWIGVSFDAATRLSQRDLLLFVPASVLGFVLCPYLDLTFHRARQATAGSIGKIAFGFGFGVVFLTMIAGSLMYAGVLLPVILRPAADAAPAAGSVWVWVLGVHLVVQTAFTLAVHAREATARVSPRAWWRLGFVLAAGVLGGMAAGQSERLVAGLSTGEVGYRLFLLAYGYVFPGYVWLCVIPTRQPVRPRSRVVIWAVASGIGFVPAWAAFVGAWSWGIAVVVALLILARAVVELLPEDHGRIGGSTSAA